MVRYYVMFYFTFISKVIDQISKMSNLLNHVKNNFYKSIIIAHKNNILIIIVDKCLFHDTIFLHIVLSTLLCKEGTFFFFNFTWNKAIFGLSASCHHTY